MTCLLNVLSFSEGIQGGLTLEITAHSRSDSKYHPNELALYQEYPFRFEKDLGRCPGGIRKFFDQRRRKIGNIIQRRPPFDKATGSILQRLRGTPLEYRWKHPPKVPIVRGLVFRSEFFRGIAFTSLAVLFRESFVNLESFYFERYSGRTLEADKEFMNGKN